ncbi:MAG: hydrogenase maturation nickel metallochaperone HypA [Phycisphaerales bacterium]|nr:MAG: hydrogenase maturation nickel metallochaperone HypA [Phycisphaerales bacterium]
MHEMMVAESLLKTISAEASRRNARPIGATISCGTLNAVNDETLRFAFDAIAKGTPCEDMRLQIEHKPTQGKCRKCDRDFEIEFSQPKCTDCGSEDFALLPDAPLMLEEIELETD